MVEDRFFDLQGERCPMLLQRIIMALEDSPPGATTTVVFNAPRLVHRLPRHLHLYGCRLVELTQVNRSVWRAKIYKFPS